ncbi:unnamed protein product [Acanthosepion pharaonis]|uniref:Uncharacterized protein n=1 Tax=Acanthosepion pharaonis TaxID=158019 RepID=A0A812EBD8_ACAPH|nr:unnamed protein product [Sepia pharaonis]
MPFLSKTKVNLRIASSQTRALRTFFFFFLGIAFFLSFFLLQTLSLSVFVSFVDALFLSSIASSFALSLSIFTICLSLSLSRCIFLSFTVVASFSLSLLLHLSLFRSRCICLSFFLIVSFLLSFFLSFLFVVSLLLSFFFLIASFSFLFHFFSFFLIAIYLSTSRNQ